MSSVEIVGLSLGLVFGFLSALHVFWAIVGVSGASVAIPKVDGKPAFRPGRLATLAVAAALAVACYTVLGSAGFVDVPSFGLHAPASSTAVLGLVMLARAIGDFRLVGFFKSVKNTPFADWDTRLFSPLCLLLGIGCLWLAQARW